MMPVASMPGRKYCANGIPAPGPTVAPSCPNTVAKMPSMMIGYAKMKTTASRSRKNVRTS